MGELGMYRGIGFYSQTAGLNLQATELGVDISIACFFSVFVWYYNLYHLPNFRSNPAPARFAGKRLWRSLLLGMVVMSLLV